MSLVLILDSKIDKLLLSENNSNMQLVNQIKSSGSSVDSSTKQNLTDKYHCQLPVSIIKFNNFILILEPNRTRVFIIE